MHPFSNDKQLLIEITGEPGNREMMPEHSDEMLMIMEEEPAGLSPGPHFSDEYSSRMAGEEMVEDMPMEESPEGSKFQEVVKAAAELRNMANRLESLVSVADLPKMQDGGVTDGPAVVGEAGTEVVIPADTEVVQGKDELLKVMEGLKRRAAPVDMPVYDPGGKSVPMPEAPINPDLPPPVQMPRYDRMHRYGNKA
jgi:hypothetical protein